MKTPDIPDIKGIAVMKPIEMNKVLFDKKHTVLTPELLSAMSSPTPPRHSK